MKGNLIYKIHIYLQNSNSRLWFYFIYFVLFVISTTPFSFELYVTASNFM